MTTSLNIPSAAHLTGDIARLISALSALTEPSPVPLDVWRDEAAAGAARKSRTVRDKTRQALREVEALAGPGATTAALTPGLVARFAARPGRASTTNGLLASLRVAVKAAAGKGWVRASLPSECVWRVEDADPPRRKHHGREEVGRVLAALKAAATSWDGKRLYAFACVLAYAGLRKTEALRLRAEDVDLKRGFLWVRPNGRRLKTASSRAPVPVPRALAKALAPWLAECGSEWLIPNLGRLGPWTGGTTGRRAADRLKAAGVAGFTPHSLRHSLATHLAGYRGLSRRQVQMVLRHSGELTQDLYVHEDLANLRAMVAGFDFLAPPSPRRRRLKAKRRRTVSFRPPARRRPAA